MTVDRSHEDKGRAYYTRMEGKKERKMIGRVVLLHQAEAFPSQLDLLVNRDIEATQPTQPKVTYQPLKISKSSSHTPLAMVPFPYTFATLPIWCWASGLRPRV